MPVKCSSPGGRVSLQPLSAPHQCSLLLVNIPAHLYIRTSTTYKKEIKKETEESPVVPSPASPAVIPDEITAALPRTESGKTVKRIVLFFTDGSFEDYLKG